MTDTKTRVLKCKTYVRKNKPKPLYWLIVYKEQELKELEEFKEMLYWEDKADEMIEAMIDDRHFK